MRKVLSLVLSLALVFGSFSFAFAADSTTTTASKVAPSDVTGTQYEDAVRVLMSLDIVTGYSDGTYKPAGAVTRAEMAAMIVRALGLDTTSSLVTKSSYSDMSGNWADKYVALVSGKNIVKGYPDGTFKPNAQVSFPEAVTMIIRALGYTDGCTSLTGTWPSNYMTLATDLDILDDVKDANASAAADRGAVAIMIYNALDVPNVTVDKEDMAANKVIIDEEDNTYLTFLSKLDVTEDDDFFVSPEDVDDEDTLCDLSAYVYAPATVYLNDDDQIIGIKEIRDDNDETGSDKVNYVAVTGEFDLDDNTVTTANGKEYDLDGLYTRTAVYLNGEEITFGAISTGDDELLDGWNITVYGSYDNGEDSDTLTDIQGVVANVPTAEYLADDDDVSDIADAIENGDGDVFEIALPTVDDDGDELDMDDITVKGDATSLSDIKENDVVTVYASGDCRGVESDDEDVDCDKVTYVVKRSTAEIKVKKVDEDVDDQTVTGTDGTLYKTVVGEFNDGADITDAAEIGDFEVGTTYTAYLDQFGYIFDVDDVDDAEAGNYAIVLAVEDEGDTDDAQIKLYTQDGDSTTFDVDSDAWEDNDEVTNATSLSAIVTKGAVIEYDTNSAGDIDEITNLRVATADYDYITSASITAKAYKASSDTYNGDDIASDAVFFDVSSDYGFVTSGTALTSSSDDNWDVVDKLIDDDDYKACYYYDKEDEEIVAMLIIDKETENNSYFAVNTLSKAEDGDGDDVYSLDGYAGATKVSDILTTGRDDVYSAPAVFVVEYDGSAIDDGDVYYVQGITSGQVTGIFGDDYSIVKNEVVTDSDSTDFSTNSNQSIELADDAIVYVAVYDDGDLDSYKAGKIGDIDKKDYVTYVLNDDGDAELVIVTENDDLVDAYTNHDINKDSHDTISDIKGNAYPVY